MKFFCNAKKRWEKTHASKLSLNEYLSWLAPQQKEVSVVGLAAETQQTDKTEQIRDSMIMICSKCDSRMEYAGEGLYKCLRCGNIFKNN
jgi:tRNA(Ile2) C34 agmatinyltransferase TiaS